MIYENIIQKNLKKKEVKNFAYISKLKSDLDYERHYKQMIDRKKSYYTASVILKKTDQQV